MPAFFDLFFGKMIIKISHCVLQANASMIEPTVTSIVAQSAKVFQIRRHDLHQAAVLGSNISQFEAVEADLRRWLRSVGNNDCVVNEIWPTSSFMHIIWKVAGVI